MRHRSFRFFLAVIFLLNSALAFGQDLDQTRVKRARTLEDYQPSSLKEISMLSTDSTLLPLRVRATYTGLTRPLPQSRKDFLRAWANHYAGSVEHYTANYKTEMEFTEDGVRVWLTVTTKSFEQFQEQIKKGQAVDLYVIRISETKTDKPSPWLLLLEKFNKSE